MTNSKNLSRFDRMSIAMGISEELKPEVQEWLEGFCKDILDRVAIGYMNTQVQKHREYREDRQRREHRDQRRFISNQDVLEPSIPPGGAQPDLLLKVNALVGGVDGVAKQLCDLREQLETLSDRVDQQFAYAHRCNAWLKDDEAEEEEDLVPDPDD